MEGKVMAMARRMRMEKVKGLNGMIDCGWFEGGEWVEEWVDVREWLEEVKEGQEKEVQEFMGWMMERMEGVEWGREEEEE